MRQDIFNTTFERRKDKAERDMKKAKKLKMTTFETYIALLKAYCAISVLIMPKAY